MAVSAKVTHSLKQLHGPPPEVPQAEQALTELAPVEPVAYPLARHYQAQGFTQTQLETSPALEDFKAVKQLLEKGTAFGGFSMGQLFKLVL